MYYIITQAMQERIRGHVMANNNARGFLSKRIEKNYEKQLILFIILNVAIKIFNERNIKEQKKKQYLIPTVFN